MQKLALITGGTSGIGFEIAKLLAVKGLGLALVYRSDENKKEEAIAHLKKLNSQIEIQTYRIDLGIFKERQSFCEDFLKINKSNALEVFVSAHGGQKPDLFLQRKIEDIEVSIQENLISNISLTHALLPKMCVQKRGKVLFLTSLAAHKINRGQTDYALSKGALEIFVKSLTAEYFQRNVNFNCLSVGWSENKLELLQDPSVEEKQSAVPLNQIASLAEFLLDERFTHISGSTFHIDGGQLSLNNNSHQHSLSARIQREK